MVSDFDFIRIHAAARKSKQRHGCFLGNLPYLPRPPAGPFPGRGCHRLRPALPHHSPACAVASPELTNTEGTPPKSLTGREKVSLCPVSVIASGLPQPDQWIAWIARTAGLHHLLKAACHRAAPFAARNTGKVPMAPYIQLSKNKRGMWLL